MKSEPDGRGRWSTLVRGVAAEKLAAELADVPWRDTLDTALDAMMVGRIAQAELMFAALDIIYPNQDPRGAGWHFAVPYHSKNRTVRVPIAWSITPKGHDPIRYGLHTYTPERRAKQILAAMLYLALQIANRSNPIGARQQVSRKRLAVMFGVVEPTMRDWIRDGLRDLRVTEPESVAWPFRHGNEDFGALEDDFEPEDIRRQRRRARMQVDGSHP